MNTTLVQDLSFETSSRVSIIVKGIFLHPRSRRLQVTIPHRTYTTYLPTASPLPPNTIKTASKALDKHRKTNSILKCKKCVADAEQKEREVAAKRAETKPKTAAKAGDSAETLTCASCKKLLPQSSFNRNQAAKGGGKARCRTCVEKSLADEENERSGSKADKISAAREKVRVAERGGNVMAVVKAEAELSALEAEHVTGLKPVVMGRRGGRGRGGRGSGRGRASTGRGRK